MKRIIVSLFLGLVLMNITTGCGNNNADTAATPASTATNPPPADTNAVTTNAPAAH